MKEIFIILNKMDMVNYFGNLVIYYMKEKINVDYIKEKDFYIMIILLKNIKENLMKVNFMDLDINMK